MRAAPFSILPPPSVCVPLCAQQTPSGEVTVASPFTVQLPNLTLGMKTPVPRTQKGSRACSLSTVGLHCSELCPGPLEVRARLGDQGPTWGWPHLSPALDLDQPLQPQDLSRASSPNQSPGHDQLDLCLPVHSRKADSLRSLMSVQSLSNLGPFSSSQSGVAVTFSFPSQLKALPMSCIFFGLVFIFCY